MIVGNVAEYIERCLESFLPIADEVCIVRAIGATEPDDTIEIARRTCEKHGKPFRFGEYKNQGVREFVVNADDPIAEDYRKVGITEFPHTWRGADTTQWPHVDDFAAARQMSFDLASSDYCFWCDTDDVLKSGAAEIRETAERGGYPVFIYPYEIFGRGVVVPRERMLLREGGKWRFPVHECFVFNTPVDGVSDERVVVQHLPHTDKSGGDERNLRIMENIPPHEMTAGMWYHKVGALAGRNRIPEAVESAKMALSYPDLGKPERYEIFLDLARLSKNPKTQLTYLHQAYATDPCRREALGLLTNTALNFGMNGEAMAYARQMMATEPPKEKAWNDREAAYGFVGVDLLCQAMRVNGLEKEANDLRMETLHRAGGPTIALLQATRGRPGKASQTRKVWLDLADNPAAIEHIFAIDEDDDESRCLARMHTIVVPAGGGCVAAWNHAAIATRAPILVQLSDDWTPVPKWDKILLERMGDFNEPKVLAISDGYRKDDLLCMAICTRKYFEQDWFLFHPWFTGVYSDNWFTKTAYERGQVIQARDIKFTHHHPLFTGKPADQTYLLQNAPERYKEGEAVFKQLETGKDWSTVPGFFNYWHFYQIMAQLIQDGESVAEVGVWLGRSIIYLAQELKRQGKHNVRLYAVDHFKGESNQREHEATVRACGGSLRSSFDDNIKRCGVVDMITVLDGDSAEMAGLVKDGSLAFCWIDAAHEYEAVKRDLSAWKPKVKKGGIFAGHDAQYGGVQKAVKELVPDSAISGCIWSANIRK